MRYRENKEATSPTLKKSRVLYLETALILVFNHIVLNIPLRQDQNQIYTQNLSRWILPVYLSNDSKQSKFQVQFFPPGKL